MMQIRKEILMIDLVKRGERIQIKVLE